MTKGAWALALVLSLALPARADNSTLPWNFDHRDIAKEAQQLVQDGHTPALALAIVHRGQERVVGAWGNTQVGEDGKPVDEHTVFRLASGTKGITATAAALAHEQGKLGWFEKIGEHVPTAKLSDSKASKNLNLFHVLSHQSGLYTYNLGDRSLEKGVDLVEIHALVGRGKMRCQPGNCYSYQNIAFQWAADVIASKTEVPFDQWVQQEIFDPLGMNDASFGLEGLKLSSSWARPHIRGKQGLVAVEPKVNYYLLPGAAGANISAQDLSRWIAAQMGHRGDVLSQPLLDTIHYPRVAVPNAVGGWRKDRILGQWYGLGWRVWNYRGHWVITHAGAVQGYRSYIVMLPDKDLGFGLMWNSQSSKPSQLVPRILDDALGIPQDKSKRGK